MGKLKRISSLFIVFLLIFSCSFSSYADVASGSDAIMTLDLDDEDYGVSVASSVASVSSTISWDNVRIMFRMYYKDNPKSYIYRTQTLGGTNSFTWDTANLSEDIVVDSVYLRLYPASLPPVGKYLLEFDYASDIDVTWKLNKLYVKKSVDNASSVDTNWTSADLVQSSGDCYWYTTMSFPTSDYIDIGLYCTSDPISGAFGGTFNVAFAPLSSDADVAVDANPLGDTVEDAYQDSISDSLSDLSSSVGSMTEDLSSAAESLQYISTSQNLIIEGIDNVIMHISDQLYAYWDQHFNLIHLPEMDKMDEIIDAIENMDLEIEVNLDGLKSTINQMSQDVQNKLQSVQDGINNKLQSVQDTLTGGYDNTGIDQDAAELDSSLKEYDEAEQNVLDNVNDSLNDFEFDAGFDDYKTIIQTVSDFLQALYDASGGLKVLINLSMLMSIAGIVIGVYRIRGGG